MRLDIKPLSVNEAWQGRRVKTKSYRSYERDVLRILKNYEIPDGNLHIDLTFGFSNKRSDIDNPVKCFIDILQKKYGFNDNKIYSMRLKKVDVSKGCEFIEFNISLV